MWTLFDTDMYVALVCMIFFMAYKTREVPAERTRSARDFSPGRRPLDKEYDDGDVGEDGEDGLDGLDGEDGLDGLDGEDSIAVRTCARQYSPRRR